MNYTVYIIIGMVLVFAIGFWREYQVLLRLINNNEFSHEYLGKIISYYNSNGRNDDDILWLIHRSSKMQQVMGSWGIIDYKPPFANHIHKNYRIIFNFIPELRKTIQDSVLHSLATDYAQTLQEAITRFIGFIEDSIERQQKNIRNPMFWFKEGVSFIISLPIRTLEWFGILKPAFVNKIITNIIFNIFSSVFALIGFIGSIFTIVLGWDQMIIILKPLFN